MRFHFNNLPACPVLVDRASGAREDVLGTSTLLLYYDFLPIQCADGRIIERLQDLDQVM